MVTVRAGLYSECAVGLVWSPAARIFLAIPCSPFRGRTPVAGARTPLGRAGLALSGESMVNRYRFAGPVPGFTAWGTRKPLIFLGFICA